MHWLMILFIGIASSIDNFAVGLSYGTKGKKITYTANLFIAFIAFIIAYAALIAGKSLGMALPKTLPEILGGAIILLIGLWSLGDTLKNRSTAAMPEAEDIDRNQDNLIETGEVFFLGIALSLNAMGTAFGAGMGGLPPLLVAEFVSILSFVSVGCGQWLGLKGMRSNMGKASEYLAACLMIAIGIYSIVSSSM